MKARIDYYLSEAEETSANASKSSLIAGASRWNLKNRKAYGICMSLYDQHPVNGKVSGRRCCNKAEQAMLIIWSLLVLLAIECTGKGSKHSWIVVVSNV